MSDQSGDETNRRVRELEERVEELESIINNELGYSLGELPSDPQTIHCSCGTSFDVNIINGLVCPDCDKSWSDGGVA